MRVGVLTFPGSNCDHDILRTLRDVFGAEAQMLWHRNAFTERFDLLAVPGGFSYGDYLRAGAIARVAPAMDSLRDHVGRGGPVIGICNGFQILCEAGLLPGALIRNESLRHVCRTVELLANPANGFAAGLQADRIYRIPVSHSDGNFRADADELASLHDNNQIVFRYAPGDNPNGALEDIAGVTDRAHRVLGMMPHPERACDPLSGNTEGRPVLESILAHAVGAVAG